MPNDKSFRIIIFSLIYTQDFLGFKFCEKNLYYMGRPRYKIGNVCINYYYYYYYDLSCIKILHPV